MNIPKKARKITLFDQVWHWGDATDVVVFWSPEKQKYVAPKWKILGLSSSGTRERWRPFYSQVMPGDVREYIQKEILNISPKISKDEKAILGKLYVYKHKSYYESPMLIIDNIEPYSLNSGSKFVSCLTSRKPILLINHWICEDTESNCFRLLTDNTLVTIKLKWPRTWSGSFIEIDPEKYCKNED